MCRNSRYYNPTRSYRFSARRTACESRQCDYRSSPRTARRKCRWSSGAVDGDMWNGFGGYG